ncbi:hypothetical protein [Streptomyces sp. Tu102]|nr:hypothetical protein [Streptomyces sp. Tu102]MBT1094981.1 hypothetical protein [Streptomyces sp. Tu102]
MRDTVRTGWGDTADGPDSGTWSAEERGGRDARFGDPDAGEVWVLTRP